MKKQIRKRGQGQEGKNFGHRFTQIDTDVKDKEKYYSPRRREGKILQVTTG